MVYSGDDWGGPGCIRRAVSWTGRCDPVACSVAPAWIVGWWQASAWARVDGIEGAAAVT